MAERIHPISHLCCVQQGKAFPFLTHLVCRNVQSQLRKGRIVKDSAAIDLLRAVYVIPIHVFQKEVFIHLINLIQLLLFKIIRMYLNVCFQKSSWAVLICMCFVTSLQFSSIKVTNLEFYGLASQQALVRWWEDNVSQGTHRIFASFCSAFQSFGVWLHQQFPKVSCLKIKL